MSPWEYSLICVAFILLNLSITSFMTCNSFLVKSISGSSSDLYLNWFTSAYNTMESTEIYPSFSSSDTAKSKWVGAGPWGNLLYVSLVNGFSYISK